MAEEPLVEALPRGLEVTMVQQRRWGLMGQRPQALCVLMSHLVCC